MKLAVSGLAFVSSLVSLAASPHAASADGGVGVAEHATLTEAPSRPSRAGVALAGSYGVVNGHHAQVFRSVELQGAIAASRTTFIGVVAGLGEGIATPTASNYADTRPHTHYDHSYWDVWFGPLVAWGAPFGSSRFGVSLQAGLSAGIRDRTLYSAFGNEDPVRYTSPFAAAAVRVAVCRCQNVRPFIGVGGRSVLEHFGDSVQSASIDLGLAFAP